ncbi:MAG: ribonuclease HII [Geminicoccaceae bacterium]
MIAGVDEVGRGPWAGPVVAAAVILTHPIPGLADSKALSGRRRQHLAALIREQAVWGLGAASVSEIDRLNILQASLLAMRRAIGSLPATPDRLLVDGRDGPGLAIPTEAIIGGDRLVPEISAASVLAKVTRDRLMAKLARRGPGYGWERNAGYGTAEHRRQLVVHGVSVHHRRSFKPIQALLASH